MKNVKPVKIKKLQLTTPDLVVLSLLSENPMHGYDINQELERRDVQDWAGVSRPQVYYSLKKLGSLKMIIEIHNKANAEGPDRQVYQISKKGAQGLTSALDNSDWAENRSISPFLTWMALSTHATKKAVASIINARRQFLEKEIKKEKLTFKSFADETGEMIVPAILMVELTIKQFETELHWLKKAEKMLLKQGSSVSIEQRSV